MRAAHRRRRRGTRVRMALAATLAVVAPLGCDTASEAGPGARSGAAPRPGAVVTGSPFATEAAARVLGEGGNAVDAAVAAAFVLAVVEPTQSGLGGRTQIVVRRPDGTVRGIDATTQVPAGYDPATAPRGETGHAAVGIPGTVAGLTRVLEEEGSWPLDRALAPAISLARNGFPLPDGVARRIAEVADELPAATAAFFLRADGTPPAPGDTLVQGVLARTLERLAEGGAETFYRGEVAEAMVRDMEAHGGFVTARDLADYRARDAVVVRGTFRGLELAGTYLPASGATAIQALQILDHLPPAPDEAAWAGDVAAALTLAFRDREAAWTGEETPEEAAARLTSRGWAEERARDLRAGAATGEPSDEPTDEPAHTSHLSVVDGEGRAVAMTQSLGPTFGSRVLTPGLGFLYASTLGGYLADAGPGARAWSSQAPMVVDSAGELRYVLGGAGGRRILSALVATLSRVADQGLALPAAVAAPRLHPTGGTVLLEPLASWSDGSTLVAALEAAGWSTETRDRAYFARLNAVAVDPVEGTPTGVADDRWPEATASGPVGGSRPETP